MSKERIFQLCLGGELPVDVTPPNFEGFRYRQEKPADRFVRETERNYKIESAVDAATYFMKRIYDPFQDFEQEELWVLLLNTKNLVTHEVMLYRGTLDSAVLRNSEVFRDAVRYNAAAVIIAHNHPSGDASPSPADISTTYALHHASLIVEIPLLDHLIIGDKQWTSLKAQGLGFPSS